LTPREYALLAVLVRNAGPVITHRQLLDLCGGRGRRRIRNTLRVHLSHLRQKLGPAAARLIRTEAGVGIDCLRISPSYS